MYLIRYILSKTIKQVRTAAAVWRGVVLNKNY